MPMKPDKQIVSPNWVILRMYCWGVSTKFLPATLT
jgi:hypothetical protein